MTLEEFKKKVPELRPEIRDMPEEVTVAINGPFCFDVLQRPTARERENAGKVKEAIRVGQQLEEQGYERIEEGTKRRALLRYVRQW